MARTSRYHKEEQKQWNTALYIRLSKEDGDKEESNSITTQRQMLSSYISDRPEFKLFDIYVDDGYTGTDFDRPDFMRMFENIENGQVNCVIVKDLSRFGRNQAYVGVYQDKFNKLNVRFIAVTDNFDSLKNDDGIIVPIKNIFNEQYAHDISVKVRSALDIKRKKGEFIGAQACYGYKKDPNDKHHLIIDKEAAPNVKLIFKLFISGMSKGKIAKELNKRNIICPSEYKRSKGVRYVHSEKFSKQIYWNETSVKLILTNQIYAGDMVQRRQSVKSFKIHKSIQLDRSEWIIVPNTHEAIIDRDTWDNSQKIINSDTRENLSTGNVYLFSGLIHCGDCGRAMSIRKNSVKNKANYTYYICGTYRTYGKEKCSSHAIRYDILTDIVFNGIKEQIKKYTEAEKLYKNFDIQCNLRKKLKTNEKAVDDFQMNISKDERLKQGLYEDYKAGVINKDEYFKYRSTYISDIEDMSNKIASLKKENSTLDMSHAIAETKKRLLKYQNINSLTRQMVVELIDSIVVYANKEIQINYTFKPL